MYFIIIAGPAGSGKSTLTSALSLWMHENDLDVVKVNLDPAAELLPYTPDVDVRRYIKTRDLMIEYGLGPNGALVLSVDYLINYVTELRKEIEEARGNYVIVDLPGQLEIVAFRRLGPIVLSELVKGYRSAMVFVLDSKLASDAPSAYASALLALSALYRVKLPMILVLNKIDLVIDYETYRKNPEILDENIFLLRMLSDYYSCVELGIESVFVEPSINEKLCEVFKETFKEIVPVSSKDMFGMDEVYASLQRVLVGGEDFLTEEFSGKI